MLETEQSASGSANNGSSLMIVSPILIFLVAKPPHPFPGDIFSSKGALLGKVMRVYAKNQSQHGDALIA